MNRTGNRKTGGESPTLLLDCSFISQVDYFDIEHMEFINPLDLVSLKPVFSAFSLDKFEVSRITVSVFFSVIEEEVGDTWNYNIRSNEARFFFKMSPDIGRNRASLGCAYGFDFVDIPAVAREKVFNVFFFIRETCTDRVGDLSEVADFELVDFHRSISSLKFSRDQFWISDSSSFSTFLLFSIYAKASRNDSSTTADVELFPIRGSSSSSSSDISFSLSSVISRVNCFRFGELSPMYQNSMSKVKYVSDNPMRNNRNQLHATEVGVSFPLGHAQSRQKPRPIQSKGCEKQWCRY